MTQYLVLIYQDEQNLGEPGSMMSAHLKFQEAQQAVLRGGEALERSQTSASVRRAPDGCLAGTSHGEPTIFAWWVGPPECFSCGGTIVPRR